MLIKKLINYVTHGDRKITEMGLGPKLVNIEVQNSLVTSFMLWSV